MLASGVRDHSGMVELGFSFPVAFTLDDVLRTMANLLWRDYPSPQYPPPSGVHPVDAEDIGEKWGLNMRVMPATHKPYLPDRLDEPVDGLLLRDDFCRYLPHLRGAATQVIADGRFSPVQREAFVRMFAKYPVQVWSLAQGVTFTDTDYRLIEDALRTADSKSRLNILLKILTREPAALGESVKRLLADPEAKKQEAGRELVAIMAHRQDDPDYQAVYAACLAAAGGASPDDRLGKLAASRRATEQTGFGLYDPAAAKAHFALDPLLETTDGGKTLFPAMAAEMIAILDAVERVAEANKEVEYSFKMPGSDVVTRVKVGDPDTIMPPEYREGETNAAISELFHPRHILVTLDAYVLTDEWRKILAELKPTPAALVMFAAMYSPGCIPREYPAPPAGMEFFHKGCQVRAKMEKHEEKHLRHGVVAYGLSRAFLAEVPADARYQVVRPVVRAVMAVPDTKENRGLQLVSDWAKLLRLAALDSDTNFADFFRIVYEYQFGSEAKQPGMALLIAEDFVRAYRLGILPANDFIRALVTWGREHYRFHVFTDPETRGALLDDVPGLREIVDRITHRAVEIESRRGDLPTQVTDLAGDIVHYEGVRHLVDVLENLGGDSLDRSFNWTRWKVVDRNADKKLMLTHLVLTCFPAPGETADTLRQNLEGRKVSAASLRATAAFAPQWKTIVDAYLGQGEPQ